MRTQISKPRWLSFFSKKAPSSPSAVDSSKSQSNAAPPVQQTITHYGIDDSTDDAASVRSSRWSTRATAGSISHYELDESASVRSSRWSTRATAGSISNYELDESTLTPPRERRSPLNPNIRVLIRGLLRSGHQSLRERVLVQEGIRAMDEVLYPILGPEDQAATGGQVFYEHPDEDVVQSEWRYC
ncbi:hypothetical protein Q7P37_007376 [Cladosporium fusiforme]